MNCRDGRTVAVVYFRAGYAPTDYPSEAVCILIFINSKYLYRSKF